MLKKSYLVLLGGALMTTALFSSCSNKDKEDNTNDLTALESQVLSSFVSTLATPLYAQFREKAIDLNQSVIMLAADPTEAHQTAARDAWREVRVLWEQSEGFLIGPVDDNNYDPYMDTWPTDRNRLDSLLNSQAPLDADALAGLTDTESETELTLRGFHPLEYLLWKDNVNYNDREKEYMQGLAQDILNNITTLNADWSLFSEEFINAGQDGSRYESKQEALIALAEALTGICEEVGDGKMKEPFVGVGGTPDSTITESPYSHNSVADFRNNIIGARNVYTCNFNGTTGTSISDLVAANNKTLNQEILQKFDAVINSFDGITTTFEKAIYEQPNAVQNVLTAIENLKTSLESLQPYLQTYVKD